MSTRWVCGEGFVGWWAVSMGSVGSYPEHDTPDARLHLLLAPKPPITVSLDAQTISTHCQAHDLARKSDADKRPNHLELVVECSNRRSAQFGIPVTITNQQLTCSEVDEDGKRASITSPVMTLPALG